MTDRISLAIVLHNHQPVGNFGWVIAEAFERAYLPMIDALERHPGIRVGLHYSGPLLDWIRAEQPSFLDRLRGLAERDQIELLGGGLQEPILVALPERDRVAQLVGMANEIERIVGRRPAGAWLAERVWEPDLPTSVVDAGYRWTIVDDAHFRAAALEDDDLWGPYLTEDQGRPLTVFGSDRRLRYGIPFGRVEEVVGHLVASGTADGDRLAFMGDDGEKFGSWPDTYDHCWGPDGWVDRFFAALTAETAIATVTPSDWLASHRPIGRIYLPTSSYFEMGEWALPADQGEAYRAAVHEAEASGAPWGRWLRGGFWRSFQVKYREVNELHKQMLRASDAVAAMPPGPARDLATRHLHQGQSNDCYWHGVFGGIYIAHMRLATLEHLIAAQDLADLAPGDVGPDRATPALVDTDFDGVDELLLVLPGQVIVIDPAEGGGLGIWDIRAVRHALTAVMRRRPEAYHARLVDEEAARVDAVAMAPGDDPGLEPAGVVTIHDAVRAREPGLAARLQYDASERRSGLVHLLPPGTSASAFAAGSAGELGNAATAAYGVTRHERGRVVLSRDVELPGGALVRVAKTFVPGDDRRRPTLDLEVTVDLSEGGPVGVDLAVEWSLIMLGGGGNPAAYYHIGDDRLTHDSSGQRTDLASIASGNDDVGIELVTTLEPPATAWWSPIETVSNSEYGFERTYQGSSIAFVWPVELVAGAPRTVRIRNAVSTSIDRSAEELRAVDR